jgi:hypothetical protein
MAAQANRESMKRAALVVFLIISMSGCGGSSPGTSSDTITSAGGTTLPTAATATDLAFCVSETNRYRAFAGKSALSQSAALESYAATGAQVDANARVPHSHFQSTNGGSVALAENELLATALNLFGTVQETMRQSIAAFYAEGPSGGHYQNLEGPYTQVGCGVFIASGLITLVQDFR